MSTSRQKISSQLVSIRTSMVKTIMALSAAEKKARLGGFDDKGDEFALKRLKLTQQSIAIWEAEAAAAAGDSLSPHIDELTSISKDARKATKNIKKTAAVLATATKIITLLTKLSVLVS